MSRFLIGTFKPSEATRAASKRILPGAAATLLLWLLAALCREPGVTEAAFPLLFLPLVSITSFIMAGKRAAPLVSDPGSGKFLRSFRSTAIAVTAECLPFVVFFSQWKLNWVPFTVGAIAASLISGLAGTIVGLLFPGKKILSAFAAAFLQLPSVAGFALIRHPLLSFIPTQGALDLFDGAFGPLGGVDLMLPLLTGTAWIGAGIYAVVKITGKTPSSGKNPRISR